MDAALRLHYDQHPEVRPTLAEVGQASAQQDGSPLASVTHHKHRAALAHLEGVVSRRRRGVVEAVVPTAVRVEAGWDRTQPDAATLNRFRITDQTLDARAR